MKQLMPGISLGIIILSNFIQPEGEDNPLGKLRSRKSEDLPSYTIQGPTHLWTSVPCFLPLGEFELVFSVFHSKASFLLHLPSTFHPLYPSEIYIHQRALCADTLISLDVFLIGINYNCILRISWFRVSRLLLQASQMAQMVKNLPAMQETWVWSVGQEDPLEKGMAPHFTILAWRIPRTEKTGGLQSTGSQRVGHNLVTNTTATSLSFSIPML